MTHAIFHIIFVCNSEVIYYIYVCLITPQALDKGAK